jgi:hypothetical protein
VDPKEIMPTCRQPLSTAPPERKLGRETEDEDGKVNQEKVFISSFYVL